MEKINFEFNLTAEQLANKQALVAKLLKDSRVKNFLKQHNLDDSFVFSYSTLFNKWVNTLNKCKGCKGLYECRQETTGKLLNLNFEKIMYNEVVSCKYLKQQRQELAHVKNYLKHTLSNDLLRLSLLEINERAKISGESNHYLGVVGEVIKNISSESHKGLYISGRPGIGKTYLLAAIGNFYAKEGKQVVYLNMASFSSECKMLMNEKALLNKLIKTITKADVLCIDDIGAEVVSSWYRDEILLPILNERMEKRALTYFTSNQNFHELERHFARNNNGSEEPIKAIRLMERIQSLSKELIMMGESRRINQNY